jgi:hypothetical protein
VYAIVFYFFSSNTKFGESTRTNGLNSNWKIKTAKSKTPPLRTPLFICGPVSFLQDPFGINTMMFDETEQWRA